MKRRIGTLVALIAGFIVVTAGEFLCRGTPEFCERFPEDSSCETPTTPPTDE